MTWRVMDVNQPGTVDVYRAVKMTALTKITGGFLFSAGLTSMLALGAGLAQADEPPSTPIRSEDSASLGTIVVDAAGMTVYAFQGDTATSSGCENACLQKWPIVTAPPALPVTINGIDGHLGVFTRADGSRQLTLDDHQLYTFVNDAQPDQANGVGKKLGDSLWGVMLADGEPRF